MSREEATRYPANPSRGPRPTSLPSRRSTDVRLASGNGSSGSDFLRTHGFGVHAEGRAWNGAWPRQRDRCPRTGDRGRLTDPACGISNPTWLWRSSHGVAVNARPISSTSSFDGPDRAPSRRHHHMVGTRHRRGRPGRSGAAPHAVDVPREAADAQVVRSRPPSRSATMIPPTTSASAMPSLDRNGSPTNHTAMQAPKTGSRLMNMPARFGPMSCTPLRACLTFL